MKKLTITGLMLLVIAITWGGNVFVQGNPQDTDSVELL
jgi:hypothetical protein